VKSSLSIFAHCTKETADDENDDHEEDSLYIDTQALRARLRSACPSGTKAIRPSKRLTIVLRLDLPIRIFRSWEEALVDKPKQE
jgi:hypothetical protein